MNIEALKKYKRLYAIIKILAAKNNNELIERVIDDDIDAFHITLRRCGEKNKGDIFYLIKREDRNEGFFAILRTSLYHLAFADYFGFIPLIVWSENCAYYEKDGYLNRYNPYEYYFKQPENMQLNIIHNSAAVIKSNHKDTKIVKEFPLNSPYYYDESFINSMSYLVEKYISFQDDIKDKLDLEIKKCIGDKKVLGIHYRGTDFKKNYNAHPKHIVPEDYYEIIDETLLKYGIEKIFLATDDQEALENFKRKYGDSVIFYKDVLRGKGEISSMHMESSRNNNNFLKGYEALRDVYTLSSVDAIVSGISMVSIFARIFKKVRKETFCLDKVIDKGININHNIYSSCK